MATNFVKQTCLKSERGRSTGRSQGSALVYEEYDYVLPVGLAWPPTSPDMWRGPEPPGPRLWVGPRCATTDRMCRSRTAGWCFVGRDYALRARRSQLPHFVGIGDVPPCISDSVVRSVAESISLPNARLSVNSNTKPRSNNRQANTVGDRVMRWLLTPPRRTLRRKCGACLGVSVRDHREG